jgi:hypothetical protein
MLALHDLDITSYSNILYDLLAEYSDEGGYSDPFSQDEGKTVMKLREVA